jgi:tRNA(fMet)-specific endonuclease VapC
VKYILDTNAVSALMRGDPAVIERLRQTSRSDVGLPAPVLAEIAYGIERLPKSRRRQSLSERYLSIRSAINRQQWTDEVSEAFGRIKASLEKRGRTIEDFDAAIAAHALAIDAVLVTANVTQMTRVPGLVVEDWSKTGGSSGH